MSKSKKHNQTSDKKIKPVFFEAVPMTFTPPAALPGLRDHLEEGIQTLAGSWNASRWSTHRAKALATKASSLASDALSFCLTAAKWVGLNTTNVLLKSTRLAFEGLKFSAATAVTYAPSISSDARAALRRIGRALFGRWARAAYISLIAGGSLALIAVGTVTATQTINAYAKVISSPAALLANKKTGVTILDRNGKVLFEGYGGQNTVVEPLGDLPKSLINATLAAEDPTYYSHAAISLKGTARAAWVDITEGGAVEGGSTITQQLVKNALLNDNKDFQRKYEEVVLAMDLQQHYSKDEILDMYLNEIYYGQGSSGVQAASETYFHVPASQLTLGESALIAGLPLGPSRFDPNFDTSAATGRRNFVLNRMMSLGDITEAQADAAEAQPIQLAAVGAPQTAPVDSVPMMVYSKTVSIQAPWFVFYVLDQLRATYGDDLVEQGGITVTTTLNLNLEDEAEGDIQAQISKLASHNVTNGALISLAPKTGDILAMVGSTDYNAPGFGNVNVTTSQRQPGSSFKPIAYATAFEKGWTGATTVLDAPVSFPGANGTTYTPQNYDLKFHGVVTLRHALDNSLNIPAIKVLQYATIPATLQTAHNMGITTLNDPSQYGLSLVLGGGDVTPIDMATVYATLDNGGVKVEPRAILKVTNREGQNITKNTQPAPAQVLDPRIAYMLTNIMSDNEARLPEFPLDGPLELDRPAAAKTGTTDDFRDNWTIGYTPQIVTAVWAGNDNNTPMNDVDGITGAAPVWHNFMEQASTGMPVENFTQPPGITIANVCGANGGLTSAGQPGYPEVFMTGSLPTLQCDSYGSNPYLTADEIGASSGSSTSTANSAPTEPASIPTAPTPAPTPTPNPGSGSGTPPGSQPLPITEPPETPLPLPVFQ